MVVDVATTETPDTAIHEALYRDNEAAYVFFSDDVRHLGHESACINADDTSFERGFDYQSDEWFECYAASFQLHMDVNR